MDLFSTNKDCFGPSTLTLICWFQIWALLELTGYTLLVTLVPLGKAGNVSAHKFVLYITATVVSATHLLCSMLLVVAAYKVSYLPTL